MVFLEKWHNNIEKIILSCSNKIKAGIDFLSLTLPEQDNYKLNVITLYHVNVELFGKLNRK